MFLKVIHHRQNPIVTTYIFNLFTGTLHLPEVVIYFLVVLILSTIMEALPTYLLHVKPIGSFVWIGKKIVPSALNFYHLLIL
jgi:hypothetical protein